MVIEKMTFDKDLANKKIKVTRHFEAPLELVWKAWTEAQILDEWWAPRPWKAETKTMNFKNGGYWLYAMAGPAGEKHWCRVEFSNIENRKTFSGYAVFCDENGNVNKALPGMSWKNNFISEGETTLVNVELSFAKESDLKTIIDMGFEEGFKMGLENLDQYIALQFKLRNEMKTSTKARVTTYLNFPGNTEEAFLFYQSVFKTEFSGKGIQRFGDIPQEPGNPPVIDSIKKMVLHVELPILGGHVLMATDAPKEMGMSVTQGNNMHICLEPETREETKRLFDALSKGGKISMPLEDMFFGSYFGECTDRFGINWMFNCTEKK